MALADTLNLGGDLDESKRALVHAFHVTVGAAETYAKLALRHASDALHAATEGAPCAAAYTAYAEYQTYAAKAQDALGAVVGLMNVIATVYESEDDEANELYQEHLREMAKIDQVSAMLEGAQTRILASNKAVPANPQPAARFRSSIYAESGQGE